MPNQPLVLHIWPGTEDILSLDPPCVSALLFLQTYIPNQFSVSYCTDPDLSPSGQLPFLTTGTLTLSGLTSIINFVSKLDGAKARFESQLSEKEKAQITARIAHVEAELGDFVAHVYFSLHANWYQVTRKHLSTILPIPQKYFLPSRLRESYKPRLQAAELWNEYDEDEGFGKRDSQGSGVFRKGKKKAAKGKDGKLKNVFEREKIIEKAKLFLDGYVKLLGSKPFFYGDRPTALDIIFAGHIHLLKKSLPDPFFHTLLTESYPTLLSHHDQIYDSAFPTPPSFPPTTTQSQSFLSLFGWPRWSYLRSPTPTTSKKLVSKDDENKFARARWIFFGASAFAFIGYFYVIGLPIAVAVLRKQGYIIEEEDGEEEEEEGEEEEDEGKENGEEEEQGVFEDDEEEETEADVV